MEVELKNIIDRIKTEGVEEAEKRAAEIIRAAEEKAKEIVSGAESAAEKAVQDANNASEKINKNSRVAIKQASRDALLALKDDISGLFERIIKKEVKEKLSAEIIEKMILLLAGKFDRNGEAGLEILLNEKDKKELEELFLGKGKTEMFKGLSFKVSPNAENGFLIGKKGENAYYDFTDDAIAEAFKAFLNPKIAQLLNDNE